MRFPELGSAGPAGERLEPGIYQAPPAEEPASIRAALEPEGLAFYVIELDGAGGKAGILDAIATGLDVPGWVGRNWDALDDALRDLSWLPSGPRGRAVLLQGVDHPRAGSRAELDILEDVLRTAVAAWASTDTPLIVVIAA